MKRLLGAIAAVLMALNLTACSESPEPIDSAAAGTAAASRTDQYPGLVTDGQGAGSLVVSYAAPPGEHVLNVNVVAASGNAAGQEDPRPREIGPDAFAELTVPGAGVEQVLYGDGDIHCPDHWAHDLSLPVGTVAYQPGEDGIEISVTLDGAWPQTAYYVEVNTEDFCDSWGSGDGSTLAEGPDEGFPEELYEGFPYGTYQGVSPDTVEQVTFAEDGTCTMRSDEDDPIEGVFSVDETTLTVSHGICAWGTEEAPGTQRAVYEWEWDGTRLTMTSDNDNCGPRERLFAELRPAD